MAQLSSSVTFSQTAFVDALGFQPDTFQLKAFDCVDQDKNVIVAAPTGSGKTLVAIYATEAALAAGNRVFYTTPIKALSNQKYHELVERFGGENVGLLTGDNAINPHASVVVMTTEVLRNMLYAGTALTGLQRVVLDEVHYLQDPYRGSVWEEVIIHLPKRIRLVCLSATVSNADELSEWIETVRGPTELVVELTRPVQLESSYLIGEKTSAYLQIVPTIQRGKPNPKAVRYDNEIRRTKNRKGPAPRRRKWKTPGPREVVALLDEKDMLPAIHFIFSRAGCEEAARSVVSSGLVLTTQKERNRVRSIVEARTASLSNADNEVLDYKSFLDGLEAGIASHHAGMIPPFKEAVEQCFAEGLIKVVFATETLALGINMPARTVVLDKLTKFTGEHHEFLTPAQYTQLIGRAGRRGIDSKGHSVILWSPFVQFEQIGQLAMSKDFELKSSFRPTYNMAANLVRRYEAEQARQLLNLSFAQFKSDATVVRSEQRTDRLVERKRKICKGIEAEFGPVTEIRAALAVKKSLAKDEAVVHGLSQLVPGEVIRIPDDETQGEDIPVAVVLAVAFRKGGRVKVTVVDREADAVHLVPADLSRAPEIVGKITLPEPYIPNSVSFRYEASQRLKKLRLTRKTKGRKKGKQDGHRKEISPKPPKYGTASEVPQRAVRAVQRLERVERDIRRLSENSTGRGGTLASQFAAVLNLLESRGYVADWELTPNGQRLARLYHECDLLIIDALDAGLFDELNAPELAGLVSVFVFTDRRRDFRQEPWFPSRDLKRRYSKIVGLSLRLGIDESDGGLTSTRQPDAGFVAIAHAWASGGDVGDVLLDEEIPAGDFIKTINQLIDLLHQISSLAADRNTARAAQQASDLLYRDLVSVASAIDPVTDETSETPGEAEGTRQTITSEES